ncbi:MAG: response regulator transcription factor [Chloroflexi bacterium]|nr:response regulator transcription factor [Chloroflexota bacterium]
MIRVLVADDDRRVRQTYRLLLKRQTDIEIIGEVENGREAIDLARKLDPDVILMDIRMPVMDGLQATRVLSAGNRFRVLIASALLEETAVGTAMANGARGYLLKGEGFKELASAIRIVYAGKTFISPSIERLLLYSLSA